MAKIKPKYVEMPITKVTPIADMNSRFWLGQELYGVKVPDTYAIAEMEFAILEAGKITTPITVSKRMNGELVVLIGNRRTRAGQKIYNNPDTAKDVLKELDKVGVYVYEGLTLSEELEIVNDQTQKKFLRSEVLNQIWRQQAAGYGFNKLALLYVDQLADWMGSAKAATTLQEIKKITDEKDKNARIKAWLRSVLDNYILAVPPLGARVQTAMFLTIMAADGLIGENDQKAEFKVSQPRVAQLTSAKEEDGDKWSISSGGPAFNAKIEEFVAKDNGNGPSRKSSERMAVKDVERKAETSQSDVAKAAFNLTLGKPQDNFPLLDEMAHLSARKVEAIKACIDELPPDISLNIRALFLTDTMNDFNLYLKDLRYGWKVQDLTDTEEPEPLPPDEMAN